MVWIIQTLVMGFLMYLGWCLADRIVRSSGLSSTVSKIQQGVSGVWDAFMDGFQSGHKEDERRPGRKQNGKVVRLDDYR